MNLLLIYNRDDYTNHFIFSIVSTMLLIQLVAATGR
jgi:hypothetical protein